MTIDWGRVWEQAAELMTSEATLYEPGPDGRPIKSGTVAESTEAMEAYRRFRKP